MLTLVLSSYELEILNDAYITLSQFPLAVQHSALQADWLVLENHDKATSNISEPYLTLYQGVIVLLLNCTH